MTLRAKVAKLSGMKGFGTGLLAVAVAAVIGVIAPVSKASAGTIIYDNWSGIGDNGITVNAGGESYSGYPIGPQAVQITIGTAAAYDVNAWCIELHPQHQCPQRPIRTDYTLVALSPAGLQSVASILNSPQPSGLSSPQRPGVHRTRH